MSYWTCNNCSKRFNQNPNGRECCGVKRTVNEQRVIEYYEKFYSDKNKTLNEVRSDILKNDFVYDEVTCYCAKYSNDNGNWSNFNSCNLVKSVSVETPHGSNTMSGAYLSAYNEMFDPREVHYCDFPSKRILKSYEVKIGGETVSKWESNDDEESKLIEELAGTGGRL